MKKLRVLHISETFTAGVYTYIKDICRFFDGIPYCESHVIYSGNRKDTSSEKFTQDFSPKIKLHEVSMTREIDLIKDIKAIFMLARKIREIKPNVIHLHSSKASVVGRMASCFYPKAKLYYTPNGYAFLREDVSPSKKRFFYLVEKYIKKLFGGVTIACGDTEYEYAKKLGRSLLVRNGVSINEVEQFKEERKKAVPFTIGTVGRMSPQKNPSLFNSIAAQLKDIQFIWVGDGELRDSLDQGNINSTGWMPREKALELINDFDVYVQTSLWEGLPFTVIEAMVLGKPIVATNVVGNKDAVKHGFNGYLCETSYDFASALKKLLEDTPLMKTFGKNSAIRAKELFDKDKNFEKLLEIYSS